MLIAYVILLFGVPSNLTIAGLGTLGRPALLWGVALLVWWVVTRLQIRENDVTPPRQPVRSALVVLIVLILISFAAAMVRGQPADQVSPAVTALVRVASWSGVVLVALDGIRTANEAARLVRALVIAAGCIALLGLAQFVTGSSLLEWTASIPGFSLEAGGIDGRGAFVRAAGTSTHPLEFVASLVAVLPLALTTAITGGSGGLIRRSGWWWAIAAAIMAVCLVAVSRSAIIGLALALVVFLPFAPRIYRWVGAFGGLAAVGVVALAVPGMMNAIVRLFADATDDPSTQSRTNALARLPEFIGTSPLLGQGWGTFLARYYIFDNQWVLVLIELGLAGVLALLGLVGCGLWSAMFAARTSLFPETRMMSGAVVSGILTVAVLFLFFDGLGFSISAGIFFLLVGFSGALRTIAVSDRAVRMPPPAAVPVRDRLSHTREV